MSDNYGNSYAVTDVERVRKLVDAYLEQLSKESEDANPLDLAWKRLMAYSTLSNHNTAELLVGATVHAAHEQEQLRADLNTLLQAQNDLLADIAKALKAIAKAAGASTGTATPY